MTGVLLDRNESSSRTAHNANQSSKRVHEIQAPRFNLKKRPANAGRTDPPVDQMSLKTVTSALLSGLFADVANANSHRVHHVSAVDEDPRSDASKPLKKSRLSTTRSMSRCGKSFKILDEALKMTEDFPIERSKTPSLTDDFRREDSLHFQLHCVSNVSSPISDCVAAEGNSEFTSNDKITFPHLPATVSISSCGTLTRSVSDLQTSLNENQQKESYGWFVEMDDDNDKPVYHMTIPNSRSHGDDLAFMAVTAPKAYNQDAEVEWAKAADTVDDVLGDFF